MFFLALLLRWPPYAKMMEKTYMLICLLARLFRFEPRVIAFYMFYTGFCTRALSYMFFE